MSQLTEHFTLEEMIFSGVAARLGMDNTPGQVEIGNLRKTATLMEAVRKVLFDKPIRISSGYRSPALNELIGGAKTSAHVLGLACDFECPDVGPPIRVAKMIESNMSNLPEFDQCILEYGWVHLGLPRPKTMGRYQFLTKRSAILPYEIGIVA